MADNPITTSLPADLPEQWTYGQTVGPNGTDVGLTQQHGYNYLMQQVNAAQQAATQIGAAFSGLYGSEDIIPISNGGTGAQNAQTALSNLGAVPNTRKINGKALSADITLDAEDVGAGPALFENTTYYVNATSGSDTTGDGSSSAPYATLQKAISVVPKNLNGYQATVILSGTFDVSGYTFYGHSNGQCVIKANNVGEATLQIQNGSAFSIRSAQDMQLMNLKVQGTNKTGYFYFYNSHVDVFSCTFEELNYGLYPFEGASIGVRSCTFNNCYCALQASYGSTIGVYGATGSGNGVGYSTSYGGYIGVADSSLTASTLYSYNGGVIVDGQTIVGAAQIETGSYVGTGMYGQNNKNTLTFGFRPRMVFIQGRPSGAYDEIGTGIITIADKVNGYDVSTGMTIRGNASPADAEETVYALDVSTNENLIAWYNIRDAIFQLNLNDVTYYYTAIG